MDGKEHIVYVTRGKKGTKLFEPAAELGEDEFRDVVLKTKEYEPKTARDKEEAGCREKAGANCRVHVLVFRWHSRSCSCGEEKNAVIEERKLRLLLEKLPGS